MLNGRCTLSEHCLGDPKRPKRAGDAGVDQLCHRPFAGACDHENVVGKLAGAGVAPFVSRSFSPLRAQVISVVSDAYLRSILDDWYFKSAEPYILRWFEQHCPLDTVQTDHHCKFSSRLMNDGERMLPNVYKAMNSWGGIISLSVFTLFPS